MAPNMIGLVLIVVGIVLMAFLGLVGIIVGFICLLVGIGRVVDDLAAAAPSGDLARIA